MVIHTCLCSPMSECPCVTGLNIFPVKSCQATRVQEVSIDRHGVAGDRRFMVVDGSGRFASQRRFPCLATLAVELAGEGSTQQLTLSAPAMGRQLCLQASLDGPRLECSVWENRVSVVDQGEEAAAWVSELLGDQRSYHRLVASAEQSDSFHRLVGNLPPSLLGRLPPAPLALADAGPVSLLSHESLADLNQRLRERGGREVGMERFRMNIEVCGCRHAYEEDEWLVVRIGSALFLAYTSAEVRLATCRVSVCARP